MTSTRETAIIMYEGGSAVETITLEGTADDAYEYLEDLEAVDPARLAWPNDAEVVIVD